MVKWQSIITYSICLGKKTLAEVNTIGFDEKNLEIASFTMPDRFLKINIFELKFFLLIKV
ncbi:MAG: hypothetical protein Kow0049_22470 [Stanieria sp.]